MPIQSKGIPALSAMVRQNGADRAQAILHLTLFLSGAGFEMEFVENDTGKTEAKFKRDGAWPYAFIVNRDNLLFYLRDVTAGVVPDPPSVPVEQGKSKERLVRIATLHEAEQLTGFLAPFIK